MSNGKPWWHDWVSPKTIGTILLILIVLVLVLRDVVQVEWVVQWLDKR